MKLALPYRVGVKEFLQANEVKPAPAAYHPLKCILTDFQHCRGISETDFLLEL